MKKTYLILPVIIFILLMICSNCKSQDTLPNYNKHEDSSKARYEQMQKLLIQYAGDTNDSRFKLLTARIETQMKLEDYLIKFRESDHAKVGFWTPIYISIGSAVLSIFTFIFSLRKKKNV